MMLKRGQMVTLSKTSSIFLSLSIDLFLCLSRVKRAVAAEIRGLA